MPASAADVLAELDAVPYGERVRRMVFLGQESRTKADAKQTLQLLSERGGFYERLLCLHACAGSQNGGLVLRSLSDPSRLLRALAAQIAPRVCTNAQLLVALTQASQQTRLTLLRGLIKSKRRSVIPSFLETLAPADAHLAVLLPFAPVEFVRERLPALAPRMGLHDWARLARFHPDVACETLQKQAEALTEPDPRLLRQINTVLPLLAETRPDDALRLAQMVLRVAPPVRAALQRIAERKPREMVDLLLQTGGGEAARVDLTRVAHRLDATRLQAVLTHLPALLPRRAAFLCEIPAPMRRAAYETAHLGWRTDEGVLDAATVGLLPADLREWEARRCFNLPALATRLAQRIPYAAFLPWDEAQTALEPFIRNPNAELRGAALSALIGVARYYLARLPNALALATARKNEQDPVRSAMLAALSGLPPSRWQAAHLETIGQIIQDALDAADLSPLTASYAEHWVIALVPFHPAWAASWLQKLVISRGQIHFYSLGDRLSDKDAERIAPVLLPVFAAWETRERERFLVQAAQSLGRRLRVFDGLAVILERVLMATRQSYIASQILDLFSKHRRDRLAALVPELLKSDASTITLPVVYNYLHRTRQDLLTPFLGQSAYKGRWSTGNTRFVLPFSDAFYRWTPAQQVLFAQTLTQITQESARDTFAVFRVINQLSALPSVFPARLIALADKSEARIAVREAALRALARVDDGTQSVPTLMEALGDDRARIAIYALRSALLEMPANRALTLLQTVPTEKVTVAKEVVRLLGELQTPAVYPVLLEMDARPLHRDVRVALLRAFWDHLESPQTWPPLFRAANDGDGAIASGVVRIPVDRAAPLVLQNLLRLLAELLQHPDPKVRMETLARCFALPVADTERVLLPPLLRALCSPLPDECDCAARAVFATYAGNSQSDADAIAQTVGEIRDNRPVLQTTLHALHAALAFNRARLVPATRQVINALADDRLCARFRAELAIAGLPWEEAGAYFKQLADKNEWDAETLMAAVRALESSVSPHPQNGLAATEDMLAKSPDEKLRRLGLAALVAQAADASGWTPARRNRMEAFCRDDSPLVAGAAQFYLLPPSDA